MNEAGIVSRTQCIWVKNAFSLSFAQYKFKHEPVFYAHLKGQAPAWYGDRKQTTVWKADLAPVPEEPETVWEVSRGDSILHKSHWRCLLFQLGTAVRKAIPLSTFSAVVVPH